MRSSAVAGNAMYERIGNAWITLFFVRMKYFFAWKVSEEQGERSNGSRQKKEERRGEEIRGEEREGKMEDGDIF